MDAERVVVCATRTKARAARRLEGRTVVVGIGARRGVPEGTLVSFGLAGALHDALSCGDVLDATRIVDATGNVLWEGGPVGISPAREGTILFTGELVDDPQERRRLHDETGADAIDMESGALARSGRLEARPCGLGHAHPDARAARPRCRWGWSASLGRPGARSRASAQNRQGAGRRETGTAQPGAGGRLKVLLAAPVRSVPASTGRSRSSSASSTSMGLRFTSATRSSTTTMSSGGSRSSVQSSWTPRTNSGGRDLRALRARRRPRRAQELRAARAAGVVDAVCPLSPRCTPRLAVTPIGAAGRPHRTCRSRGGDRDEGRAAGPLWSWSLPRMRGSTSTAESSRSSPRRRCRWTT